MALAFEKYAKIPRLRGVRLTITEKLDGTNAQIVIPEDTNEPLQVGSRNRWITPGKTTDNYGFANWVSVNDSMLRRLGPGRHFGEWWGVGVARTYNLTDRRWSLFNVYRFADGLPDGLPSNIGVVPVLYQGDFSMDAIEQAKERLATSGSVAVPGFMKPEGIVCRIQGGSGEIVWKWTFDGDAKPEPSPEQHA